VRPYNHVVGAIPSLDEQSLAIPSFPTRRTGMPDHGLSIIEWCYSEAPLDGVVQAQLCMDGGFCIGLLLQYQTCSRSLGQFRYDKDISEWFHSPSWISIVHERGPLMSKARIDFVTMGSGEGVHPMTGIMVWWYAKDDITDGKDISDVRILPM
jgi:hypothetical protein